MEVQLQQGQTEDLVVEAEVGMQLAMLVVVGMQVVTHQAKVMTVGQAQLLTYLVVLVGVLEEQGKQETKAEQEV